MRTIKNILKKSLILSFLIIIIYGLYNIFSYSTLPDTGSLPINVGVTDGQYLNEIAEAQKYLKSIPKALNVPSFSVAVGIKGEIVWSEAIGLRNIQNKVEATTNTIYRIGSTSKAVTSTLAAKLFEEGLLDLEYEISNEINNFPIKEWKITPRQLLSHSAGIPDYEDLRIHGLYSVLCNCRNYPSVTESLDIFNDVELQYEPNKAYEYSSFDFVLLSAYLEKITNTDFLTLLNQKVFHPLSMDNTFGDHSQYVKGEMASFYETKGCKYRKWKTFGFIPNEIDLSYKWAGGGFMSTPTDLVKMGNAILSDSTFLSENTLSVFFKPQKLSDGKINPQKYALGWRSYEKYKHGAFQEEVWMVHHGGVSKGSMNFLVLFPDYNMVINASINTRTEDFLLFWDEVMELASFFLNSELKADGENKS